MKKKNKFVYLHVLQANYGFGWEDLCADESYKVVHNHLRKYNEGDGGYYRIIRRREANTRN